MRFEYETIDDARTALAIAEADVAADCGPEAVESAWSDIVYSVAYDCAPDVRSELLRMEGLPDSRSAGAF